MRSLLSSFFVLLVALMLSTSAVAEVEAPDVMLQRITNEMITALRHDDKQLHENPAQIYPIIDKILVPHIDWLTMSQWVVGRTA